MRSRIAELCGKRGISRYRLAREAGISRSAITAWERRGLDRAELGAMVRVARALGVGVEDLYEREGPDEKARG